MSLHLLPGLGATSALYLGYDFPVSTHIADYLRPPKAPCSFVEYAQFLIKQQKIQPGDSLIGVSLGGMLACEISQWISISKITLISSCTNRLHLNPVLRRLSFLGPHLPWQFFQSAARPIPGLSESRRLAVAMFREADSEFVRWACSHAADWAGLAHHPDIVSIHGDRDPVFPIQRQKVHQIIPGGDHLMVISRRTEILPLLLARHS